MPNYKDVKPSSSKSKSKSKDAPPRPAAYTGGALNVLGVSTHGTAAVPVAAAAGAVAGVLHLMNSDLSLRCEIVAAAQTSVVYSEALQNAVGAPPPPAYKFANVTARNANLGDKSFALISKVHAQLVGAAALESDGGGGVGATKKKRKRDGDVGKEKKSKKSKKAKK
jgi:hypothetical protein